MRIRSGDHGFGKIIVLLRLSHVERIKCDIWTTQEKRDCASGKYAQPPFSRVSRTVIPRGLRYDDSKPGGAFQNF
jgi:hypothetical protein